jgi:hypothetical protein
VSILQDAIADTAIKAFNQGLQFGASQERANLLDRLDSYLQLTREPNEAGEVTDNPEWEAGFQAAMALIRNYA